MLLALKCNANVYKNSLRWTVACHTTLHVKTIYVNCQFVIFNGFLGVEEAQIAGH